MIAFAEKLCRTCNAVKPRAEFYVSEKRPSGRHKLMAKCKACQRMVAAGRKRKRDGEYRTLSQIREVAKKCESCGKAVGKQRVKCSDCQPDAWGKAAEREARRLRCANKSDEWMKRCLNAQTALRQRARRPKLWRPSSANSSTSSVTAVPSADATSSRDPQS
jgi:hypothetical protein